ncbi:hypothetical protein [Altererythrobacter sp. Root672]|uniref:hypothetical protein n=1 Tax=Altererythrobacter sp. Root672 TaxID=1736584 RepID=UPI0006F4E933|nr:hypothetical protein [Altererythrobacter sp. Root672]KRA83008.1 hypothetical protein ASD76_02680 [Altererythrobacter sp. Root672]
MAAHTDVKELNLQQQLASIRRDQAEIDQLQAEVRKLAAETKVISPAVIFQGMIATAALLGAGAAIAKLFFP